MKNKNIVYFVLTIVLILALLYYTTNEAENFEIVNRQNSYRWRIDNIVDYLQLPVWSLKDRPIYDPKRALSGRKYKIDPNEKSLKLWYLEKCNKFGSNPPYTVAGCEDSMAHQEKTGSCDNLYCNK